MKTYNKRHCEPLKAARQSSYAAGLLRQAYAFLAMTVFILSFSNPAYAVCSNPTGAAGTMIYNEDENVPQYCDDTNWIAMAPLGGVDVKAVTFDGTNDDIDTDEISANIADSKLWTVSVWFRRNALSTGNDQNVLDTSTPDQSIEFEGTGGTDGLLVIDADGGTTLDVDVSVVNDTDWHHLLFSFDMANAGTRKIYVDDVDVTGSATFNAYVDAAIDFDGSAEYAFGAGSTGGNRFNGDLAELWYDAGTFIDLSVEENRRKFITAHGKPAFLGKSGQLPTGSSPDIYLSGDNTEFHKNKGTGGGFTVNGALTNAATEPDDIGEGPGMTVRGNVTSGDFQTPEWIVTHPTEDYVYTIARVSGTLKTVDVSDPDTPTVTDTGTRLPGSALPSGLDIDNGFLYTVGPAQTDLDIYSLADPSAPTFVGTRTFVGKTIDTIHARNNFVYTHNWSGTVDLNIIDVSDPTNPSSSGQVTLTGASGCWAGNVYRNHYYISCVDTDEVIAIDISDPANPVAETTKFTDGGTLTYPREIEFKGDYAFVAERDNDRIVVIDISDPTNMTKETEVSSATQLDNIEGIHVYGDYLYAADASQDRLTVIDVSDPTAPVIVDSIQDNTNLDAVDDVRVKGQYAYLIDQVTDGVVVVDLGALTSCVEPPGVAGTLYYNADTHTPMYCDGDHWVSMAPQSCDTVGEVCADGSVYAGLTPDGDVPMYVARCDAGEYWDGSTCAGTRIQLSWNNGLTNYTNTSLTDCPDPCSDATGEANTNTLIAEDSDSVTAGIQTHDAAQYCADLTLHGSDDWYLPAYAELTLMYNNKDSIGNFRDSSAASVYQSSTENSTGRSRNRLFQTGAATERLKEQANYVRCARTGPLGVTEGNGLIAYWPLNESGGVIAQDVIGGHHGILENGPTFNSTGGQIAGALDFDGTDDYILINTPIVSAPPFTICAWVNLDQLPSATGDEFTILMITDGNGANGDFFNLRADDATNFVQYNVKDGSTSTTVTQTSATVTAGVWQHYCAVEIAADDRRVYLDAANLGTNTTSMTPSVAATFIGASDFQGVTIGDNVDDFTDGQIDDVRVYDRALSEEEITEIYNAGNNGNAAEDCTSPNAAEGTMIYNTDDTLIQYCDGANWIALGKRISTVPVGCGAIGDLCADGSIFAGDGNMYVTDANQTITGQWKGSLGNDDINPDSDTDGEANHDNITVAMSTLISMNICETLSRHGHNDWYLPARDELTVLYNNRVAIDANATESFVANDYWSSTEDNTSLVWRRVFPGGAESTLFKNNGAATRCVRREP